MCVGLLALAVLFRNDPTMNTFTTAPITNQASEESRQPIHHILCYGDSLTLGLSPPDNITADTYCPYSIPLKSLLDQHYSPGSRVHVDHLGNSGKTTTQLLKHVKNPKMGLLPALRQGPPDGYKVVIILAGTNDILRLLRSNVGLEKAANYLVRNLWTFHEMARQEGAHHSLAVGIPPSKYQHQLVDASQLVTMVNQQLQERMAASANHNNMTFVPFPFPFEAPPQQHDNNNHTNTTKSLWSRDGLHLSCLGYEALAQALAPVVVSILDNTVLVPG